MKSKTLKILDIYILVFYIYAFWICFFPFNGIKFLYVITIINNVGMIFYAKKLSCSKSVFDQKNLAKKVFETYFGIYNLIVIFNTVLSFDISNEYITYIIYIIVIASDIKFIQLFGDYFSKENENRFL